MIIVKSPFRISLFGGSTDYKDFYEKHGSFIIGTTIDKNVYFSMRIRPSILTPESVITYSQLQHVSNWNEIHNPLIREILNFRKIEVPVEMFSFSDVPSRTGLGGSSAFCVGLLYAINKVFNHTPITKQQLISDAIYIERTLLNDPGGIQDHIWPVYGGLNTIEINNTGRYSVKPLAVTPEFKKELQDSMVLIYTNDQREQDSIAKSHENKDKTSILQIAKTAHEYFLKEDIKQIGKLLYISWEEKMKISPLVSTTKINDIVSTVMRLGAYGVKLLGAGGCGFILVMCDPLVKKQIVEKFQKTILEFQFEKDGVSVIYNGTK